MGTESSPHRQDRWLLGISGLLLAFGTLWPDLSDPRLGAFGAEYGNIAENLLLGNGFSGPFGISEEPTAWMPPLLPMLIAGVFLVAGTKTALALRLLLSLQSLFLWLSLLLLMVQLRRLKLQRWPLVVVFALYLWANRQMLFYGFHDVSLTILFSCLALEGLLRLNRGEWKFPALVGGLVPLASPALTLAYGAMTVASKAGWRRIGAVLICVGLSTGLWTVRNAVTLQAFVPLKSNLWFDFHQANVLDRDGVASYSSFIRYHPFGGGKHVQTLVYKEGEIPFMQDHKRLSYRYLQRKPKDYLSKVASRIANAVWRLQSPNDLGSSRLMLEAPLQAKLLENRLVVGNRYGVSWTCLDSGGETLGPYLSELSWQKKYEIIEDWELAREELYERQAKPLHQVWGYAHALLPSLIILFGLLRPSVRRRLPFRLAVGLYLLYLLPYVLVSHYSRYQLSLIGLMSLLIVLVLGLEQKSQATRLDPSETDEV
jgi:hypothetical protein